MDEDLDFDRDGVAVARGLLSEEEVAAVARDADALLARSDVIDRSNLRCRWADHVVTGACRVDAVDPVIDLSPAAARVASHPRILSLLEGLLREPAVLFKDKLIYKLPGAPGYPLHQDYIAWDEFPRSFTTVVIAIDRATEEAGATEVFLGQHTNGSLAPEDGEFHRLSADAVDASRRRLLLLEPGDAAVFGGFVPHRSAPNTTDAPRRALYLSYQKRSEGGDRRASHYLQFQSWLRAKYAEHGRGDTWFR